MAFPYTYKQSLFFVLKPEFIKTNNKEILIHIGKFFQSHFKIKNLKIAENKISFTSTAPIFNFEYSTNLVVTKDDGDINIHYEVNLEKLLTIALIAVILTAFFSFVSIKFFLILSAIFSVGLYSIFYLIIDNVTQTQIKKAIDNIILHENHAEKITDEQNSWINDDMRCSACGNYLEEFELHCKECGLKLKRNRYTIPLDTSKYKDKEVLYHFKGK